jgi:acetylornithine deacetylase/succinyl-diaminopimelate desuccinylase-like protein
VLVREGGSIPIVSTFAEVLGVPILMMGFGLPDDGLHSPNERFKIENFYRGIQSVAVFLDRLGAGDAGP